MSMKDPQKQCNLFSYKCGFHSRAASINFMETFLRLLFERGFYSRAASIMATFLQLLFKGGFYYGNIFAAFIRGRFLFKGGFYSRNYYVCEPKLRMEEENIAAQNVPTNKEII